MLFLSSQTQFVPQRCSALVAAASWLPPPTPPGNSLVIWVTSTCFKKMRIQYTEILSTVPSWANSFHTQHCTGKAIVFTSQATKTCCERLLPLHCQMQRPCKHFWINDSWFMMYINVCENEIENQKDGKKKKKKVDCSKRKALRTYLRFTGILGGLPCSWNVWA